MTENETRAIYLKLINAFDVKFVSSREFDTKTRLWDQHFKNYSFKVVNRAVDEWIEEQDTMPKISQLLPRCRDLRSLEQGSLRDAANIKPTWEMIYDARHGELKDEDVPSWIHDLSADVLKAMFLPPPNRKVIDTREMGRSLPYET